MHAIWLEQNRKVVCRHVVRMAQAKRALIPLLVPHEDLPLSATLDAFGWSLMAAVGASVGGLAVSWLGVWRLQSVRRTGLSSCNFSHFKDPC